MVVNVIDIKANPYRRMDNYPINQAKVKKLMNSMDETGFWDNILARPKDGIYELAYGHHRWIALQKLGIEKIDIPIKELDDETMLKIMANENMQEWEPDVKVINETVFAVKEFLNSRVLPNGKDIPTRDIIRFLGKNWTLKTVKQALATLNEKKVEREATETFAVPQHADIFRKEMGREIYQDLVPKDEQKDFAEEIIIELEKDEGEVTSAGIKRKAHEILTKKADPIKKERMKTKEVKDMQYQECSIGWTKAWNTIRLITVKPSDLLNSDVGRIEGIINKIENAIQEWRAG